jgi:hypothetical protein
MTNLFTKEELIQLNEMMLGRGMPVQEDGIGYNKADYGACANYFFGCSDAQYADLAKRLVKYCKTQLGLEKEDMKATQAHFEELAGVYGYDREDGVSLNITENGTLISFRYNETFIEIIKAQPKRQYDAENKQWVVPNDRVIPVLNELSTVGADVRNALEYAMNHELIQQAIFKKVEVLTKHQDGKVFLKFPYNKEVLEAIKEIEYKDRQWNAQFKFWAIEPKHLDSSKEKLQVVASFKLVQ